MRQVLCGGNPLMRLRSAMWGAVFLTVLCAGIWSALAGRGPAGGSPRIAAPSGPELVLSGMDLTEIRDAAVRYRLRSDRAAYSLLGKRIAATNVSLSLPEPDGEVRVAAPSASWDMDAGKARFPDGCAAERDGGYRVNVPSADLDVKGRVLSAWGPVELVGPGFRVAGDGLVWRWREGKADMQSPRTVLEPGILADGKRG